MTIIKSPYHEKEANTLVGSRVKGRTWKDSGQESPPPFNQDYVGGGKT